MLRTRNKHLVHIIYNTERYIILTKEELKEHIKSVDNIYYKRPKRRNCVQLIKDKKVLFTIKDGTGTTAANAFQRGLWATNISFIKTHINIKNIPIKEISFYDN